MYRRGGLPSVAISCLLVTAEPICEGRDSDARLLLRARFIVRVLKRLQLWMQQLTEQAAVPTASSGEPGRPRPDAFAGWRSPDARRLLQLGLAGIWLLDAVLQCQPFMFTTAFGQMLASSASGSPHPVAAPIGWAARIIEQHPDPANSAFAAIQFLIAVGIAWRPAVKVALAASVGWSVAVWWFGEGLGGVLTGTASPVNGAPGAVILYALLAVLLWPADRDPDVPFPAGRAVGRHIARAAWLLLWGSLAWFAVAPASRTAQGLHDLIAAMTSGEPGWLATTGNVTAGLVAHRGGLASVVMAIVLVVVAAGVLLPAWPARVTLVLAIVVAAVFWVPGEALGGLFTGSATDPNTGPLLMLLALAYWPET
jgi:hypothetical protein